VCSAQYITICEIARRAVACRGSQRGDLAAALKELPRQHHNTLRSLRKVSSISFGDTPTQYSAFVKKSRLKAADRSA
jgi:hypothetical protein